MLWHNQEGANVIFQANNCLIRVVDNKVYLGTPFDSAVQACQLTEDGKSILINGELYPLNMALISGAISIEVISSLMSSLKLTRKQTGLVTTDSDMLASTKLTVKSSVVVKNDSLLTANALYTGNLSKTGQTPISTVHTATHIFYADSQGVYVWVKSGLTFLAYALAADITSIAKTNSGIYLSTNLGVYFISFSNLLVEGNRSAFLTLKYTTATSPSIQSNSVLDLAGEGNSLLITTTAGLDYMPNDTLATVYRYSYVGVTKCAISPFSIGCIAASVAYKASKPVANFSVSASDIAGNAWLLGDNLSSKLVTVPSKKIQLSSDGKMAVEQKEYKFFNISFYNVATNGDLSLISTFNLTSYYTTKYGATIYIGKDTPVVVGEYAFVFPIGDTTGSYNLTVFRLNTTLGTYTLIYDEYLAGYAYGDKVISENGLKVHTHRWGLITTIDGITVQLGTAYTISGSTVTPYMFWAPNQCVRFGWTPDGNKLIILRPTGLAFCDSSGHLSTICPFEVSSVAIALVMGDYLYTIESDDSTNYICLYHIAGTAPVFKDKLVCGDAVGTMFKAGNNEVILFTAENEGRVNAGSLIVKQYNEKLYIVNVELPDLVRNGDGEIYHLSNVTQGGGFLSYTTTVVDSSGGSGVWLETSYLIKLNRLGSQMYTTANDITFIGNDLAIATDNGIIFESNHDKAITKQFLNLDSESNNILGLAGTPSSEYRTGSVSFYTTNLVGIVDIETAEVNPYKIHYLQNISSVWIDSLSLYGANNFIFSTETAVGPFTDFAYIKGKADGVFSLGKAQLKQNGLFIPVVNCDAVFFIFSQDALVAGMVITIELFRLTYTYVVQVNDTKEIIGEAFASVLRQQGYKATSFKNGFTLNGVYGLFANTSQVVSKFKSPFIRIKQAGLFAGLPS